MKTFFGGNGGGSASGGGTGDVVGPAASTDTALAVFDSTTGKLLKNGVVTESAAGAIAGATQLTVDNVDINGNTISALDSNGNIALAPPGTGVVGIKAASASGTVMRFGTTAPDDNYPGFYLFKVGSAYKFDFITSADGSMATPRAGGFDFITSHASNPGLRLESNGNISLATAGSVQWSGTTDATAAKTRGIYSGAGSPEGALTAGVGSLYLRTDGGAGTSAYIKESGTGNTGWKALVGI